MIKYIGQHIVNLIARFRGDVYLENIADGTVANDKFLGLDSDGKIVKETVVSSSGDITSVVVSDGVTNLTTSSGDHTTQFLTGEGIDVSVSSPGAGVAQVTYSAEDATDSNKGIASFSSDNFAASSGAISIKSGGVDLTDEVTGILPVGNGGTGLNSISTLLNSNTTKSDVDLANVENKSSATIRGEIVSGDIPNNAADTSGNAATATALATARNINGVSFDGSSDITITNKETLHINIVGPNTASTNDYVGYGGHYQFNIGAGDLANNDTKSNNWASKWSHYRCLEDTTITQAKAYVSTGANFNSQIRFFKTAPNLNSTTVLTLTHLFDLDFTGNASAGYVSEDTDTAGHSLSAGDLLVISVKKGSATSGQMFAELSIRLEY